MYKEYTLSYLPLFELDMAQARDYILYKLNNPSAAIRLVKDTDAAIRKRLDNPLGYEPYHSSKDHRHPYYCIHVRNFIVFYVVTGKVMEVRRFLYGRRNLAEII